MKNHIYVIIYSFAAQRSGRPLEPFVTQPSGCLWKFRYADSIWFDEGIRRLDNYKLEFTTSELSAGIGYSF